MIRHITTRRVLENIRLSGVIRPQGDGNLTTPECNYNSFELVRDNNIFHKAYYHGNSHRIGAISDLVGLILDENELLQYGFEVLCTDSSMGFKQLIGDKEYSTKKENEFMIPHCITREEYEMIGEYVFVRGDIPIGYIRKYEQYD